MTVQLEYTCTEEERKEAQSLHLHRQYGGGPKWRSTLFFYAMVAVIGVLVYLRFKLEIAPKDRWWFILLVIVVYIVFLFFKRKMRRKAEGVARLEISEQGIVFDGGVNNRTTMPWSAFKECLESPGLFALVHRTNSVLYVLPKRAFPDESSQNWFRSLANQPKSVAASSAPESTAPGRFAGRGVTLTVQLKYRDYLTRMLTSWRMRGIAIVIGGIIFGTALFSFINPPPDAVVPPWKVFLFMMATIIPMFTIVFFVVTAYSWLTERKLVIQQHVSLSSDGIEFASSDATGLMPWTTYKFYLENRWAFFIWHPSGSLWFMFPKRNFASPSDLEQCRTLFQTNLKPSRWFYM